MTEAESSALKEAIIQLPEGSYLSPPLFVTRHISIPYYDTSSSVITPSTPFGRLINWLSSKLSRPLDPNQL